jgi:hypothetical protein
MAMVPNVRREFRVRPQTRAVIQPLDHSTDVQHVRLGDGLEVQIHGPTFPAFAFSARGLAVLILTFAAFAFAFSVRGLVVRLGGALGLDFVIAPNHHESVILIMVSDGGLPFLVAARVRADRLSIIAEDCEIYT